MIARAWWGTLLAVLVSGPAFGELLQYAYTDPAGTARTAPPDQALANPASGLRFALSGGLDRIVRVEIKDSANRSVASAQSGVLGGADKITVAGRTYYGAWLSVPVPKEGGYTVHAQILDNRGRPLQDDPLAWTVDRTPPKVEGRFAYWAYKSVPEGSLESAWMIDITESKRLSLSGISDPSGIGRVEFESVILATGEAAVSMGAAYDPAAGLATIGTGQSGSVNATHLGSRIHDVT